MPALSYKIILQKHHLKSQFVLIHFWHSIMVLQLVDSSMLEAFTWTICRQLAAGIDTNKTYKAPKLFHVSLGANGVG